MNRLRYLRITLLFLCVLAAVPFAMNYVGFANYLFLKSPDRYTLIAFCEGTLLLERGSKSQREIMKRISLTEGVKPTTHVVQSRWLSWAIRGRHGIPDRIFHFDRSIGSRHSSVEFPWLLGPLTLLLIALCIPHSGSNRGGNAITANDAVF